MMMAKLEHECKYLIKKKDLEKPELKTIECKVQKMVKGSGRFSKMQDDRQGVWNNKTKIWKCVNYAFTDTILSQ